VVTKSDRFAISKCKMPLGLEQEVGWKAFAKQDWDDI